MDDITAERFVGRLNHAIRHTDQQFIRPAAIEGVTCSLFADAGTPYRALVWVSCPGDHAFRFIFVRGPGPGPRYSNITRTRKSLHGFLEILGMVEVPGNVLDVAYTKACVALGFPAPSI